jgi:threonine aldolase
MGNEKFIRQARRVRKVLGGGMRQAGILAAAAVFATEHHVDRLATDHLLAKKIGEALQKHPFIKEVMPVETNLVIFELTEGRDRSHFISGLREKDILLLPISDRKLRIVTHLDISEEMVEYFLNVIDDLH